MDKQSRAILPEELIQEAENIVRENPGDILNWLLGERNLEVAKRVEAFAVNNIVSANHHDARANKLAETARELVHLRGINKTMQKVLISRIMLALDEAEKPAWQPTHRHYKGTQYRVTGRRKNAIGQELEDGVDYDDAQGNRYWLPLIKWESLLESGKPRYQVVMPGDA